jgi:PA domain
MQLLLLCAIRRRARAAVTAAGIFPAGSIALIQHGTCTFRAKVDNAAAAGAVGVIIFNEGREEGPTGSGRIEDVFKDFFTSQSLASEPTAFDGRSDYDAFINVGIPAGGLFTGAEGVKTAAQAAIYGGVAGASYDPCSHAPCDSLIPVADGADAKLYAQLEAAYDLVGNINRRRRRKWPTRQLTPHCCSL